MWWKKGAMKTPEGIARQVEITRSMLFLLPEEKMIRLSQKDGNLEADLLLFMAEKLSALEAAEKAEDVAAVRGYVV